MRRAAAGSAMAGAALMALGSCNMNLAAWAASPVLPAKPVPVRLRPTLPAVQGSEFALVGEFTQGGWIQGLAPVGARLVALNGKPLDLEPDGRFFAAFDRDAPATLELVARRGDAPAVRRTLTIAPRAWRIENINAARAPSNLPTPEFLRIREVELAKIGAARDEATDATGWRQDFGWPIRGRVSGLFGSQRVYRGVPGAYHGGMDIAAAAGTPYAAPADGVVVLAADAPFTLEGNLLIVDHGSGLSSAFLHSSRLAVRVGEHVRKGQLLGYVGMTGRATGPHLHWALKWRDARLDPLLFLPPL